MRKKNHITAHDIEKDELGKKVGQGKESDKFVQEGKEKTDSRQNMKMFLQVVLGQEGQSWTQIIWQIPGIREKIQLMCILIREEYVTEQQHCKRKSTTKSMTLRSLTFYSTVDCLCHLLPSVQILAWNYFCSNPTPCRDSKSDVHLLNTEIRF